MQNLKQVLRTFAEEREWDKFHSPKNLSMALSVEVSELMEHFQWATEEESKNPDHEKLDLVKDEVADVLIYLVRLADKLGIDPVKAAYDKMKINAKKYPVNKARGNNKKYSEL